MSKTWTINPVNQYVRIYSAPVVYPAKQHGNLGGQCPCIKVCLIEDHSFEAPTKKYSILRATEHVFEHRIVRDYDVWNWPAYFSWAQPAARSGFKATRLLARAESTLVVVW